MPAINLAHYKKLRKEYDGILNEFMSIKSRLDTSLSDLGIGDIENSYNLLESLEELKPRVNELILAISVILSSTELKSKAQYDFELMSSELEKQKRHISTLIREIEELIKF